MNKQQEKILEVYNYIKVNNIVSIRDLSKKMNINWRTADNYIELFSKLGLLKAFKIKGVDEE